SKTSFPAATPDGSPPADGSLPPDCQSAAGRDRFRDASPPRELPALDQLAPRLLARRHFGIGELHRCHLTLPIQVADPGQLTGPETHQSADRVIAKPGTVTLQPATVEALAFGVHLAVNAVNRHGGTIRAGTAHGIDRIHDRRQSTQLTQL